MNKSSFSKIFLSLSVIIFSGIVFSCASTQSKASDEPKKVENNELAGKEGQTSKEITHPFNIDDVTYQEILEKSLISSGNNYRMKKVIEKLRAGENVYIACLGGSVTEGAGPSNFKDGYAYQFRKKLVEKYTPNKGANVYFDGAGLSGTPSLLGLIRYQQDVVDVLGHVPDIFIIEFCVNDGGDAYFAKSHEALIRNALEANPETCVIELYSDAKSYRNSQQNIMPVSTFYRLPQISIQDTVEGHTSIINQDKFFADYVHPTKEGHEIMADCLMYLFDKVDSSAESVPFDIPEETIKYPAYTNFKRILGDDENIKITEGAFSGIDNSTQGLKKTGKGDFPFNWKKSAGKDGDSMVIEANCKAFFLTYKVQGSWESEKFGSVDVYIDGKYKTTFDGGAAGGWNNCEARVLIDNEMVSQHKIELKMKEGSEKMGFTVIAMGYTK